MKLTPQELYNKLVNEYKIIGEKGSIDFTIKDLKINIQAKDTVGNLIQEWIKAWMTREGIDFIENSNKQKFPDFYLDPLNTKTGLLEIKSFNGNKSPGFDLANFDSYCNSLLTDAYRLDSDYLIIAYKMDGGIISIKDVWLKKIWELSGPSDKWPLKVQDKKDVIYNIRPIVWFSTRATFKAFSSKEDFLKALDAARYKYPQTHYKNAHWLDNVKKNYFAHTKTALAI